MFRLSCSSNDKFCNKLRPPLVLREPLNKTNIFLIAWWSRTSKITCNRHFRFEGWASTTRVLAIYYEFTYSKYNFMQLLLIFYIELARNNV